MPQRNSAPVDPQDPWHPLVGVRCLAPDDMNQSTLGFYNLGPALLVSVIENARQCNVDRCKSVVVRQVQP